MTWPCFWVEPLGQEDMALRRYASGSTCPGPRGIHDATSAPIGRRPWVVDEAGHHWVDRSADEYARDDPRWPPACACGYEFANDDEWQFWTDRLWATAAGKEYTDRSLPPGAMFHAGWQPVVHTYPDGVKLTVVLPPGDGADHRGDWWCVDGASRNNGVAGPGWTRIGDPRQPSTLTITPSILTDRYHGFLPGGGTK